MGGGDLNAKKAWHPSTLKNQERVWKAEQAAAEEKKRILELQRERAKERDMEELNELTKRTTGSGSTLNENRLNWMYDKPDKKIQEEDYLLGKSIDPKHDEKDRGNQDVIPAVARRVVGSSMLAISSDTQVDLARKLREDPLLLIKERERAAKAALLNNPLQRRRLTELLRKEQDQSREIKKEKKSKRKHSDLDNILAAKLNALGAKKSIDLKTLLASDDSSSSSSSDEDKHQKKKKNKNQSKIKKSKKKHKKRKSDSGGGNEDFKNIEKFNEEWNKEHPKQHKRKKSISESEDDNKKEKNKKHKHEVKDSKRKHEKIYKEHNEDGSTSKQKTSDYEHSKRKYADRYEHRNKTSIEMSKEEKAAKLAEMAAAGVQREVDRGRRVAEQLAKKDASETRSNLVRHSAHNEARSLPESLESRIHSNRHNIQRNRRHMDEHFARR